MQSIKIVVLGDDGVGKTSLLMTYSTNAFPTDFTPPVSAGLAKNIIFENRPTRLDLIDTASGEDHGRLREILYPGTDIVLLTYSCVSPASFGNIRSNWYPEIQNYMPNTPFLLVATKTDLLENEKNVSVVQDQHGRGPVTAEEGRDMVLELGASAYIETSAIRGYGVTELFTAVIRVHRGNYNDGNPTVQPRSDGAQKLSKCALL